MISIYDGAKKKITIAIALFGFSYLFDFETLSSIFFVSLIILIFLYRQGSRYNLFNNQAIHNPIDGRVISIENTENDIVIVIENSILDMGCVFAPLDCDNVSIENINGLNYSLNSKHAHLLNEKNIFTFKNKNDISVKMEINSGILSSHIQMLKSELIKNGEIVAHILQGNTRLYIPTSASIKIDVGDNVQARSILGHLQG